MLQVNQIHDLQISSQSVACLFAFLMVSFEEQTFLTLMKCNLSLFKKDYASVVVSKKVLLNPKSHRFSLMFFF